MADTPRPRSRSGRRGPAAVPAVVVGLVCVVVAALALPPALSSPPAVAELSPQAVSTPEEAETALAGGDSAGSGATGPGSAAPEITAPATTAPTVTTIAPTTTLPADVARRRCVPNGDGTARQTDDPLSPPCVPIPRADATTNGGATWQGVTADEIRVAVPTSPIWDPDIVAAYEAHFNERYEFHGRRLTLVPFDNEAIITAGSGTLTEMAVHLDEELEVFATTGLFRTMGYLGQAFYDELSRRQIISVESKTTGTTLADMQANAPYQWSWARTFDQVIGDIGDLACTGLVGRTAAHAGAGLRGAQRSFGILHLPRGDGRSADLSPLTDRLAACGASVTAIELPNIDGAGDEAKVIPSNEARAAISRLQTGGVTTVVALVDLATFGQVQTSAESQLYQPEWIGPVVYGLNSRGFGYWATPAQLGRSFSVDSFDPELPPEHDPARQYLAEAGITSFDHNLRFTYLYRTLVLLAAGIQGAGPELTPQTFATALEDADWWASRARTAGGVALPRVDIVPGEPVAVRDVAVHWFDYGAQSPESGYAPAVCTASPGVRFQPGSLTVDADDLFTGGCTQ